MTIQRPESRKKAIESAAKLQRTQPTRRKPVQWRPEGGAASASAKGSEREVRRGPSERQTHGIKMPLRMVRDAVVKTQIQASEAAGIQQSEVSRLERAELDDVKVATLRRYLESLGASLELVAVFAGGHRIIVVPPE